MSRARDGLWWAAHEIGSLRRLDEFLRYIKTLPGGTALSRAGARRLAHALASLCESHETGLDAHLRRTSAYAMLIARHWQRRFGCAGLGAAPEDLAVAALLHDIGKIGVPQHILAKPGPLTSEERATVERHPRLGCELLRAAAPEPPQSPSAYRQRLLTLAGEVVLHHHERWDGTGYPDGLAGRAIPLSARLVAVADVYDALRHARPYKDAWTEASARDYLRREAGTHLDPEAVSVFLEVIAAPERVGKAARHARVDP